MIMEIEHFLNNRADEVNTILYNDRGYLNYEENIEKLLEEIKKTLSEEKQGLLLDLVDYSCYSAVLSQRITYKEGFLAGIKFLQKLMEIK